MTTEHTEPLDIARAAIDELKAESIQVLDVRALTTIADDMIICSGNSSRHVKRIGETVIQNAKQAGLAPRVEGLEPADWALIDLGGVIVHVMQPATRAYYQIEKLWDVGTNERQANSSH
ncbi:ribosome silencing factor [Salinisphaera sp. USBA-960]|uniref:ribosome silencing factor n=1 Tax=Salinisphaera orenii TaxID=856731 RepID=UPI000DBE24B0|nr:ribosome silencing factor [Salifodinibacter halophilus]NNC25561.1 ribosome silencing factor [Salifodinibacter halophilus]